MSGYEELDAPDARDAPRAEPRTRGHGGTAVLALVCATTFMLVLDLTAVVVALADLQRDLDAGIESLQWVVDAYALAMATFLLAAAALSDRLGRLPLFIGGTAVFTIASLACGLAPGPAFLIGSRAVQGAGGAVLFGLALPLLGDEYPPGRARDTAIGVFGAVSGGAVALGPLIGGALTGAFGWRAIFFVNAPIGIVCLFVLWRRRRAEAAVPPRGAGGGALDGTGAVTVTAAVFLFVLACVRGDAVGWASPLIVGAFAGSAVLIATFVAAERRAAHPLMDVRLFRRPGYATTAAVAFAVHAVVVGALTYMSIVLQNAFGRSPAATGLVFLPFSAAAFLSAPVVARLMARVAPRTIITATAALAGLGLALAAALWNGGSWAALVPGFVVVGVALGTSLTALNRLALLEVEPERSGMATGGVVALRQIGVALGVAALGVVYQQAATAHVRDRLLHGGVPAARARAIAQAVGRGGSIAADGRATRGTLLAAVRHGSVGGVHIVLYDGALFVLVIAAVVAFVPAGRRPGDQAPS